MAADLLKTTEKKPKLVRDRFTMPKTEYAAIDALKTRAVAMGTSVKKSELLRAGLIALQSMGDAAYKRALAALPAAKTGRPAAASNTQAPAASARAHPARKAAAKSVRNSVTKAAVKTVPKAAPAKRKRAPAKRVTAKA